MDVTDIIDEVCELVGLSSSNAKQCNRIERAITNAGAAACQWEGRDWWFLRAEGAFSTVSGTPYYALRTVDTTNLASLWGVQQAYWDDDWPISPISYDHYDDMVKINSTGGASTHYALTADPPKMYLWPVPNSATTVNVRGIDFHHDINFSSVSTLLLVPSEFHYPVYVNGAVFALNNAIGDPADFSQSPSFVATMNRLATVDPTNYDPNNPVNMHPDSVSGTWPHDKRVWSDGYETLIMNDPEL